DAYSAKVGRTYRAIGSLLGDTIYWLWIGTHEAYNRVVKKEQVANAIDTGRVHPRLFFYDIDEVSHWMIYFGRLRLIIEKELYFMAPAGGSAQRAECNQATQPPF